MDYSKAASKAINQPKIDQSQKQKQTKQQQTFLDHLKNRRGQESKYLTKRSLLPPTTFLPAFHGQKTRSNLKTPLTIEEQKEELYKQLNKLETPFNWKPTQVKPINEPTICLSRLREKDEQTVDESRFKWRNFILQLVICYELFQANEVSESMKMVVGLEEILRDESLSRDWLFQIIEDALWHVVTASKVFLYLELNLVEKAKDLIDTILPHRMMKLTCKAGIHGIKAAMFMEYGHKGNENALIEAWKAVTIDRTNAEWHFLIGKCMGRIRRVAQCYELVDPLEVKAIDKAISLNTNNPLYKVYLGQVLREKALKEYQKYNPKYGTKEYKNLRRMNAAAKHKYIEARKMRPDCPRLLSRCALGMIKLPPDMVDLTFTRECIDKAIEMAPNNPMAHHVKALYYERFHVELDVALDEMKKAAELRNFGAAMDLVRMHNREDKPNIIQELENVAAEFQEPNRVQVVYAQAGSYLLFIKKDFVGAMKYFNKVIDMDVNSYALTAHKSMFLRMKDPVNMFDVLLAELDMRTEWKSFTLEEKEVLKKFRIKARIHATSKNKEILTVEKILEMSKLQISKDLNKRRQEKQSKQKPKKWHGKKNKTNNNSKGIVTDKIKGDSMNKKLDRGRVRLLPTERSLVRNSSIDSSSTVESDYERDSTVYGPKGFFNKGSTESLNSTIYKDIDSNCNTGVLNMFRSTNYSKNQNRATGSKYSRDQSISSTSSNEQKYNMYKATHESRNLNRQENISNAANESKLTVKNLKLFDSTSSDYLVPGRSSFINLPGTGSGTEIVDSTPVMDRVKASYRMLDYKKVPNSEKKRNGHNSGSSQSLNKIDQSYENNFTRPNLRKSESTQSLNQPQNEQSRNGLKPRFCSRDSSVKSTRSSTSFMPSFASKKD